jgi:hypothetical protein
MMEYIVNQNLLEMMKAADETDSPRYQEIMDDLGIFEGKQLELKNTPKAPRKSLANKKKESTPKNHRKRHTNKGEEYDEFEEDDEEEEEQKQPLLSLGQEEEEDQEEEDKDQEEEDEDQEEEEEVVDPRPSSQASTENESTWKDWFNQMIKSIPDQGTVDLLNLWLSEV